MGFVWQAYLRWSEVSTVSRVFRYNECFNDREKKMIMRPTKYQGQCIMALQLMFKSLKAAILGKRNYAVLVRAHTVYSRCIIIANILSKFSIVPYRHFLEEALIPMLHSLYSYPHIPVVVGGRNTVLRLYIIFLSSLYPLQRQNNELNWTNKYLMCIFFLRPTCQTIKLISKPHCCTGLYVLYFTMYTQTLY